MRPKPQQRKLESIVADLLGPLLSAQPPPGGFRLASWDVEQGLSLTLARDNEWLLIELEDRDDSRPCHARTHWFNVCARYPFDPEKPLGNLARRAVDQLLALIRHRETRLPVLPREAIATASEVREILVDRMLIPQAPGHYYLNAYVGCMIGCEFCYVAGRADLSRRLEGRAQLPWGRYVDVKVNAAEVLKREVSTLPPGFVRMSPILTDPYQPLEKTYRITRQCLQVLLNTDFVPGVLTRAGRVRDDIDLLAQFRRALVGISIPTDDDAVRQAFEPGGDPIDERLAALEASFSAGLVTVAVIQPMLPMNPDRLAARLAPYTRAVRIDRMYDGEQVKHLYERAGCLDALSDDFFVRTEAALKKAFAQRGVLVDPLDDMTFLLDFAPASRTSSS